MKELPSHQENFALTPENTASVLQQIGKLREQRGMSESLIPRIDNVREQAEKLSDYTTAVILYQEKLLCGQHLIMENKSNPLKIVKGLAVIEQTNKKMMDFQKAHEDQIDPVVKARSWRFLGRHADLLHHYSKSEEYYRQGISFFEPLERVDQRYQRLELSGFLSFSLLKQGKPGWLELTQKTLEDFDYSSEGFWLKEHDYYTWAVWKSGIEIRNSDTILNSRKLTNQHRVDVEKWLDDADSILKLPNGDIGDFGIRRQEFYSTLLKLN